MLANRLYFVNEDLLAMLGKPKDKPTLGLGDYRESLITQGDSIRFLVANNFCNIDGFMFWLEFEVAPTLLHEINSQPTAAPASKLDLTAVLSAPEPTGKYALWVKENPKLMSTAKVAAVFDTSANTVHRFLESYGVICRDENKRWVLADMYKNKGFARTSGSSFYWTQKGRLFIYNLLLIKENKLPAIEFDELLKQGAKHERNTH